MTEDFMIGKETVRREQRRIKGVGRKTTKKEKLKEKGGGGK